MQSYNNQNLLWSLTDDHTSGIINSIGVQPLMNLYGKHKHKTIPDEPITISNDVPSIEDHNHDIWSETWFKVFYIYVIVQAVIGIIAIEFAWHRTQRFRE